jgi:glycerol kinase
LGTKKQEKAVYKAIVWQDRRTEDYCKKLRKQNKET